jgi:PAS domain S-box-containing protein
LEAPFRELLQNLDAIVWRVDATTLQCTFVNRRVEKLLGYSVEEWTGDPEFWMGRLHPDDGEGTLALLLATTIDGHERQSVHRAIAADGRVLWLRTTFRGAPSDDGTVSAVVGMMVDISEQVRAVATLSESEARTRVVLERAPLVVWTTDRALRYTSITGAGLARLGLRPHQLTGSSLHAYLQTDDANHPHVVAHRRALDGESVSYDGDWGDRTFQNHVEPFRDAGGGIIGTLGIAFDITERKQVERERDRLLLDERAARAEAEAASERAAFLAQASAVLSSSLDYAATLATVARLAVPRLADWSIVDLVEPDATIRRVAVHQLDPAHVALAREIEQARLDPRAAEGIPRVLRTGRPVVYTDLHAEGLRLDGDRWCDVGVLDPALEPLMRAAGATAYMAVPLVARDRTLGALTFLSTRPDASFSAAEVALGEELGRRAGLSIDNARLYADAREAVRVREEFLAVASHELRTPMTSVLLGVQGLEALVKRASLATAAPAHVARLLDSTGRQAHRMADLIDSLLDVSRIQAGRFGLHLDVVDLASMARDVAARLEPDRVRAGTALELRADHAVVGRWDRSRLDQVVTNLLSNAMKFGAGKPIELSVDADPERATLTVRDHGIGIPSDRQEKIFELFERAVSSRNYGGLGLGLYIVRRIVDAHGGTVQVTSAPGAGATFIVSLPRGGPAGPVLAQ